MCPGLRARLGDLLIIIMIISIIIIIILTTVVVNKLPALIILILHIQITVARIIRIILIMLMHVYFLLTRMAAIVEDAAKFDLDRFLINLEQMMMIVFNMTNDNDNSKYGAGND